MATSLDIAAELGLSRRLPRALTGAEIRAYQQDGAAVIRGIVPLAWIELMRGAVDRILAEPGRASVEYTPAGKPGRYYGDFYVWMRDPDFGAFKGSYRWGKMYAPAAFGQRTGFQSIYDKAGFETLPPLGALLAGHSVLSWETEPGDAIVHHPLTIHFSAGNRTENLRRRALALRYLGDDACYDARPGTFMENPKVRALFASEDLLRFEDGAPMINAAFPLVWPAAAPR